MDKKLKSNNPLQNAMALNLLLENGRVNILNDDLYNKEIKRIENDKSNSLMTPEFRKEVMEIARYMASMKEKDLRTYIYERVKEERKIVDIKEAR